MAAKKIAISVPEDVLVDVDEAAAKASLTRSAFITRVLVRVAGAHSDAELKRRVDALFADDDIAREQSETARATARAHPGAGSDW